MTTLKQIKAKYPTVKGFKYSPYENCPRCHGNGEYKSGLGTMTFCFCLFVGSDNPKWLQITHDIFNNLGKRLDE